MRDGDDRRIRAALARLNLHQVRIGQRNRADADAHEADVEVLRDGARRADAEDEDILRPAEHAHRLLDLLEVKQLERPLERVDIPAEHTLRNGRNTIGFGQIFKNRAHRLGRIFRQQQLYLAEARAADDLAESNNTRFRDVKLGRHLLNADRGNMYRIG